MLDHRRLGAHSTAMNPVIADSIRPLLPAFFVALCAVVLGHGIGVGFGAFEDEMKQGLQRDADAVVDTVYGGDAAKAKATVDKSWTYYKRAHLHAGSLGATALVISVLLALLPGHRRLRGLLGLAAGIGSFGYGAFWLLAGMRAPALGGTGIAKESLWFVAQPSVALLLASIVGTLALLVMAMARPKS